jgi:hypothetical protein
MEKITLQKASYFILFTKYSGDQIEGDEMGGECTGYWCCEKCIHNFSLKEYTTWKTSIAGSMTLKWILNTKFISGPPHSSGG